MAKTVAGVRSRTSSFFQGRMNSELLALLEGKVSLAHTLEQEQQLLERASQQGLADGKVVYMGIELFWNPELIIAVQRFFGASWGCFFETISL